MPMITVAPDSLRDWQTERTEISRLPLAAADERLRARAQHTRRSVIRMISQAGAGHIGGDLSVTDILTTVFFGVMRVDPDDLTAPDRDCFILSKGHCAAALYSTLAAAGYIDESELETFMAPGSALNGHPSRGKVAGVETSTGPLGHGLPVGVGTAIAAKLTGSDARTYVVTGDGEMQEGSNWEALMAAAQYQLDNLTLIVDRNRLQQGARTEDTNGLDPLDAKLAAFGWNVRDIDGHDFQQLLTALTKPSDRPVAVIANTIKGKGVSFMEDRVEWHHKVPDTEQVRRALAEVETA
jgi:transketolase